MDRNCRTPVRTGKKRRTPKERQKQELFLPGSDENRGKGSGTVMGG